METLINITKQCKCTFFLPHYFHFTCHSTFLSSAAVSPLTLGWPTFTKKLELSTLTVNDILYKRYWMDQTASANFWFIPKTLQCIFVDAEIGETCITLHATSVFFTFSYKNTTSPFQCVGLHLIF